MSRHERRDGLCTWHILRQVNGANAGTFEYVAWVGEIPDDQTKPPSYVRSTSVADGLLILNEDRARAAAAAMNRSDRGGPSEWSWQAARARP